MFDIDLPKLFGRKNAALPRDKELVMKTSIAKTAAIVYGCIASCAAYADQPAGVGAADIARSPCFGPIVVGPPGNFLPYLDGVYGSMRIELGDAIRVEANSANGNVQLSCHGTVTPGDVVIGTDLATGDLVEGTVAERGDSCDALVTSGLPSPCRGEGERSAIIIGPDFAGQTCSIGGTPTFDWKVVLNEGGVHLSCLIRK